MCVYVTDIPQIQVKLLKNRDVIFMLVLLMPCNFQKVQTQEFGLKSKVFREKILTAPTRQTTFWVTKDKNYD